MHKFGFKKHCEIYESERFPSAEKIYFQLKFMIDKSKKGNGKLLKENV